MVYACVCGIEQLMLDSINTSHMNHTSSAIEDTNSSATSAVLPALAGTTSVPTASNGHTDQPLATAPTLSLTKLQEQRRELESQIKELEEKERVAAEQEAAAEQVRVASLVQQLPTQLGVASLGDVISLIRSVQGRIFAAARKGISAKRRNKHNPIPADTKAHALAAIIEGIKAAEFVRRFGISVPTYWNWRRQLKQEGKLKGNPSKRAVAKAAHKALRKSRARLNARGRRLVIQAPYPEAKKAAIVKRLVAGESVTALRLETGVSSASLFNWRRAATAA